MLILWLGACAAAGYALLRITFWSIEGYRMRKTPGYLPPPPSRLAMSAYRHAGRLLSYLYIGRTRVYGAENLQFEGRLLIGPNHQHGFDPFQFVPHMQGSLRGIGSANILKGPLSGIAAWMGVFAVPTVKGHAERGGGAVVNTCARVLAADPRSRLLMFPQGTLKFDNYEQRPEDYRTGAFRAMQKAQEMIGDEPLAYLPVAIHYRTDSRGASIGRRLLHLLFSPAERFFGSGPKYGATCVIGKPILFTSLPQERHAGTDAMRLAIKALLEQAMNS